MKREKRGGARARRREWTQTLEPVPYAAPSPPDQPGSRVPSTHEGFLRAVDPAYAERLFSLSPDVRHASVPLQRVLGLFERALAKVPHVGARLACETPSRSFAFAHGALSVALGAPVALRGGNHLARGFGARGSEFPRLGALLRRRDYYSDTSCSRVFRTWEEAGIGYRKQRLEQIPIQCPKTGRQHAQRFGRNDHYLSREMLQTSAQAAWLRPLVTQLRKLAPQWLWRATQAVRKWRRRLLSFVELVTLTFGQRKALLERRRAEAQRLRRWRRTRRQKQDKKQAAKARASKVPITPAFSPTEKRRIPAPAGGEKDGATAPGTPGEQPSGLPPSSPGAADQRPAPPAGRHPRWAPPQDSTPPLEAPSPSGRAAGQGRGRARPWSRYLDAGPPSTAPPEAPDAKIARPLSPKAHAARERLRRLSGAL